MSKKEKVLAYLEEWVGKGTNPANGFEVVARDYGEWSFFEVCMNQAAVLVHNKANALPDHNAIVAARILKLDKPKAAEIHWQLDSTIWRGDSRNCGNSRDYSVWPWGDAFRATGGDGKDIGKMYYDTVEEAKKACQDHKQQRYNKLGGYNE